MTEQERKDVVMLIWTNTSMNLDYLNSLGEEDLKRLYKDKVR